MADPNVLWALAGITEATGVKVALDSGTLTVDGRAVSLPAKLTGERAELLGTEGLLLTVPRADDRDKLLWRVIAEAGTAKAGLPLKDRDLASSLADRLDLGPGASTAVAEALKDRFFNHKDVKVLLPVHASLPLNYEHTYESGDPAGYRMFNGGILPFLLWDSRTGSVDAAPVADLLRVAASQDDLTVLDRRFLEIALDGAPKPDAQPEARALIGKYTEQIANDAAAAGGMFCQPSLDLFRRDLRTVLATDLPRPDKIQWLTLLLSLHLTVRLYRIAVVKGTELDNAVAAAGQLTAPSGGGSCPCPAGSGSLEALQTCTLAGLLRFRTGSGHYRPVSNRDGCRSAYAEIDQRRLLDMPATLVTANLASRAWHALGGGEPAEQRDLKALAEALNTDPGLRTAHSAACAAIAVLHHDAWRKGKATFAELEEAARTGANRPGLHALRDDVRKMRRRDLRHQSRDIVNQLMVEANLAGPGSLITRNGTLGFYEIDEELAVLLVRLVCQDRQLPYETFLEELRAYGLTPQDAAEQEALADALERLGMLARYSDSGEASFVHYA
ncbi:DNA phosphorothioation-dependent restriction protein DptG [Kitasatospora sp. MBT66]|uniref:DNA phosphorothioation-dependent restriction protein DptG n=1 Tax=Kitasatospora sp. MBT66 TaxID=1444769 RepID=UPI0005BAA8B2|nr:DNA phosphorothioation-dependent restriction protein DptG [Kitasatospora sp. MBT66]